MEKYLWLNTKLLEVIGILDTGRKWSFRWFRVIVFAILMLTLFISGIAEIILTSDDFSHFNDVLSPVLVGVMGITRYINLLYHRKRVTNTRNRLAENKINSERSKYDDSVIKDYDRRGFKFTKNSSFCIFIFGGAMLAQNLPDFISRNYLHTPFDFHNTWTLNSTVSFVVVYSQQILAGVSYALLFVGANAWTVYLSYHACGHMCVLQNYLERIAEDDEEWTQHRPMNINERIAMCVRYHENICRITDDIEIFFSFPNLVHFLVCAVAICTSVYELTTDDVGVELLFKHASAFLAQCIELCIVNWCGQMIIDESIGLSLAISRSNFYKLSTHHQRDLSLILLRAQKPMYITAGKFTTLSLESILVILKGAMSTFAMFTNVGEQQ